MSSRIATFPNASPPAIAPEETRQFNSVGSPWQSGTWRCGRCLVSQQALPLGVTWALGIACAFLLIGGAGLREPIPSVELHQLSGKPGSAAASDHTDQSESAMVEMSAPPESNPATTPDEPTETPQIWEPQDLPQAADLPPVIEALDSADLFAVPAAAEIEPALKPDQPKAEKRPTPTPSTTSSRTAISGSAATSTTSSSGGNGDSKVGSGGKGKFPAPPYPSFARSRGMQGTTYLSIRVGAGGTVESVTVSNSSGYSDLDSYASSWVRKYWRWPSGIARSYRQPFVFRLR